MDKQGTNKTVTSKGKNDNREQRERGFEALLRPIQDIIAKDWKVRLCNYLDSYMQHVHNVENISINFSEAAILLQNTSSCYSKRVDLMYNWVLQFTISLSSNSEDIPNGEEGTHAQKKTQSHKKRLLQTDTLQCLDYSIPDNKTNVNLDKIGEKPIKKIILSMTMKAPSKPSTSCTVFQSNNEEMGYKEEFRLHWKTSNDGPLNEDFYNSNSSCLISAGMDDDDDDDDIARDCGADTDFNESMGVNEVTPMDVDHDPSVGFDQSRHIGNLDQTHLTSNRDNFEEAPEGRLPEDPFCKVIQFALSIIHRKFKKARCSKKEKKDKQKSKKNDDSEDVINYHLSFSEILGGVTEDIITLKLRKRKEMKLKINQEKKADVNKNYRTTHIDNDVSHDMDNDEEDYVERMADLENSFDGGRNTEVPSPDFENGSRQRLAYLQDFFKAKSNELESSTAVNKWHRSIEKVVEKAQENSIFDVHAYGTKVIETFSGLGETKSFDDVVIGQPKREICRYLLSSLMLANTYNVELSKTDPSELSKDCLNLKLISIVRHHEELDANVGATTGT